MKINFLILIASLFMNSAMHAQSLQKVVYTDGSQQLNGWVTANKGMAKPGVLILPAWMGADDEARQAASDLEKQGYIAFIADIYGEGNVPQNSEQASKIATHYKTDFKAYQHRIALALEQLKKAGAQTDRLAVIGYCFGGTGALEAARAQLPVQGVVSIHGGLAKGTRPDEKLSTRILVLHGADDASVSETDIRNFTQEVNHSKADWQMIYYANSKHTFTNPASADYNKVMSQRSWQHTLLFLEEILK